MTKRQAGNELKEDELYEIKEVYFYNIEDKRGQEFIKSCKTGEYNSMSQLPDDSREWVDLELACELAYRGYIDPLRSILDEYPSFIDEPNQNTQGENLFQAAVNGGNLKTIEFLLLKNPEFLNFEDDEGNTPLDYAIFNRLESVINYLESRGALRVKDLEMLDDEQQDLGVDEEKDVEPAGDSADNESDK